MRAADPSQPEWLLGDRPVDPEELPQVVAEVVSDYRRLIADVVRSNALGDAMAGAKEIAQILHEMATLTRACARRFECFYDMVDESSEPRTEEKVERLLRALEDASFPQSFSWAW